MFFLVWAMITLLLQLTNTWSNTYYLGTSSLTIKNTELSAVNRSKQYSLMQLKNQIQSKLFYCISSTIMKNSGIVIFVKIVLYQQYVNNLMTDSL